ncbi:MAG: hypothetical protein IPM98_13675 [Lewinellaceae bacterium]|nr:hypothetical protein [Lewinellaceae bacterium]
MAKWIFLALICLASCKTLDPPNSMVQKHTEKATVFLIKLPPSYQNDAWFDGGNIEISKPKRGRVILQFEASGTVNQASVLSPNWEVENPSKIEDYSEVKEVFFNTQYASSIDVTELRGTYLILYGSCNIAGSYKLILK